MSRYGPSDQAPNIAYGRTPFSNVGFRPLKKNPFSNPLVRDPGGGGSKKQVAQPQNQDAKEVAVGGGNLMDTGPDDHVPTLASAGGSGNVDRTNVAQGYGYERGTGNVAGLGSLLGAATGIPFVGGLASKGMDALGLPGDYGEHGTTDAMGNIYGSEGRAYDPVTGRAVGSYGNSSDFKNAAFGGYQNLRDAGLNPIEAGLGSYENSIYNPAYQRGSDAASRAARLRGGAASEHGITSTAGIINQNTFGQNTVGGLDAAEDYGQRPDTGGMRPVTGEMLGFDDSRAFSADQASQNTGQWGHNTGDIAATEFGPGVINDSGQIEHAGGTVVALTDTRNPGGENISLLNGQTPEATAELARRASNDDNDHQVIEHKLNAVGSMDAARSYDHGSSNDDSGGGGGGGGK